MKVELDAGEGVATSRAALVDLAIAFVLAAATVLAYVGVRHNAFILFDDPGYVLDNAQVKRGLTWEGVRWALTTGHASNWHPLTWMSHMLDVELFGLDAAGHHATSVALHVASTLLLLWALRRITGARWPSAVVAALFALHPLHVESVAWVAERKDVLSMFFVPLVILAYARYVERPSGARYALVAFAFALGLMSKPMLVTLPCVLLLLDIWPLRRVSFERMGDATHAGATARELLRLLREKLPLFALAALSALVTYRVQNASGAVASIEHEPVGMRVANALLSYARYLGKTFWPVDLAVYYPFTTHIDTAQVVGACALLVVLSTLALWQARKRPWLLVGWLWYVGTLVPVIGLVQVGNQAFADRYSYIPLLGIFIALVWSVDELCARLNARWLGGVCALGTCAALFLTTRHQLVHWKDTRTLFEHTVAVTDDNPLARQLLGRLYLSEGDTDRALEQLAEAARLLPKDVDARMSLAAALAQQSRFAEAVIELRAAVKLDPRSEKAHYNLGYALDQLGQRDAAVTEYERALALDPEHFSAHVRVADALLRQGRVEWARTHVDAALAQHPRASEARMLLARCFAQSGDVDAALNEYQAVVSTAVDRGRMQDAIGACEQALELARSSGRTADMERWREQLAKLRASVPAGAAGNH